MKKFTGPINICSASDINLIAYVPTLINSISQNTRSEINFYLLARGIPSWIKDILFNMNFPKVSLKVIDMDNDLKDLKLDLIWHTSRSTMDRIFIPSLFPNLKRMIYLDIDLLVQDDISKLYTTDVSDKGICAKSSLLPEYKTFTNMLNRWVSDSKKRKKILSLVTNPNFECFNAGVLLLDLDKLRQNKMKQKLLKLVKTFGFNDQVALNVYANGDYHRMPSNWNVFIGQENPQKKSIIHWVGCNKPWNKRNVAFYYNWKSYFVSLFDGPCSFSHWIFCKYLYKAKDFQFYRLNRLFSSKIFKLKLFFNRSGLKDKRTWLNLKYGLNQNINLILGFFGKIIRHLSPGLYVLLKKKSN